ncbi:MAG: hypothetical protein KA603_14140 [Azonexus sp.]|nr:hypothetical protein [Betaproteobacteria bacterium]MBK8919392.1 hypothetical protein [Betaproteobacteria bacterium]MBP6037263.1 hypothetical protein [Azonexus sp.]MBP6907806.1 hypothetical protein [Azonexus sp.]
MARFLISSLVLALLPLSALAAEPPPSGPKLASGLLMKQEGKLVFAPCRDRSYALVDDISPGATVTAALESVGLGAGKKLYVELWGTLEGIALKVTGLNLARADGRCQPSGGPDEAWRAAGSEPAAWTLAAGGDALLLKRPGRPEQRLGYKGSRDTAQLSVYEGTGEPPIAWRFEQKSCRDRGSDAVFGWTASLTVAGEILRGCAWQR